MLANVLPHGKKLTLNWLILKFASMLSFKWNIVLFKLISKSLVR